VSWQAGAFAILAVALAAGFRWYDHDRPDARVVALVGTLAAFAALGRIAFAAVPNVKPTTDIVLIAGFALGGGPGFAVGAIAGLSSNFFFGQGPWTPWQMAAWGAAGVIGAGLAALMRRGGVVDGDAGAPGGRREPSIGRWPLALVCCAVGFGFTAFQDVGDWVTFSDHSWAQLGVYVGQGLGFDAVHAAGCVGFALLLGPALLRSIQRFAQRLEVTWVAPLALALVLAGGVGLHATPRAQAAQTDSTPTTYLLHAENDDGGFGAAAGAGQPSNQLYSGWAALGLASAGVNLNDVAHGGHSLLGYIRAGASTGDVGSLERTILVAGAAGLSARDVGGHDLLGALERHIAANGSVQDQVNLTAFAILALRAAGETGETVSRPVAWLVRQQDRDGGFSFSGAGGSSDIDDTGATLEALAGQGEPAAAAVRRRAVTFLRRQQDPDGGFPSQPDSGSNAQSTAWAIQGLDAAGVDPNGLRRHGARSPLAYLRSLIGSSGVIAYARGVQQTPVWVTGEALMALEGKALPLVAPAAPAPHSAPPAAAPPPAPHHRVSHRTRAHAHGASHRSRSRRHPVTPKSTGMQSGTFDEAVGVLTALVFAPVGAG
jgi:energy-coupling factor transport system substrate-specific component